MASKSSFPEYVMPETEDESNRLDSQHRMLTRTFGGLHRAPLNPANLTKVLDIGCGTGNWAIDFAKQYPQVSVTGFDIFERSGWKNAPKNCSLKVADLGAEETWSGLGKFDYIHGRYMVPGVRDWSGLVKRCFEHLSSGGILEMQEFVLPFACEDDEETAKRSKVVRWGEYLKEGFTKTGLRPSIMDGELAAFMKKEGFEDIVSEDFKQIIGPWPEDEEGKVLGKMGLQNEARDPHGFSHTVLTKGLGWSDAQVDELVREVTEEMLSVRFRLTLPIKVVFAKRP